MESTLGDFHDVVVSDFEGRQAHSDNPSAAIRLEHGSEVTIRNCKTSPGTQTFLSTSKVTDGRLFIGNDLGGARVVFEGGGLLFPGSENRLPGGGHALPGTSDR